MRSGPALEPRLIHSRAEWLVSELVVGVKRSLVVCLGSVNVRVGEYVEMAVGFCGP